MPVVWQPLPTPSAYSSMNPESLMRRAWAIENYLLLLSSAVNAAESSQDGEASPASKRESLLAVPCGVTSYV
jgi:hypothetical protein|tara:strand:- start:628 stop:843 length:216 start_codon:yes stop_codon:yes gene_type:complete